MAKKTNQEYKKDGYYKDYEKQKNAGKNAQIKYRKIRRQ